MIEAPELLAFLRHEEIRAQDSKLNEERKLAISFYNGEPFGDELEGRSQLVTRDVAEVIDQQTISILRTMISGDHVVEFDGEGDDGTDYGQEATEAVKYQFMRKQRGYFVLHDSLKAGLLEKTGLVKSVAERRFKIVTGDLTDEEITIATDEGAEILQAEPNDDGLSYRVVARTALPVVFRDIAVPNEEFGASPDTRCLDESPYLFHETPKSIFELLEMGFELDDVESAYSTNPEAQVLADARDSGRSNRDYNVERTGHSRVVWLREEYLRYDVDGYGQADLICVHRIGGTILSIEKTDEQPFSGWTPFPMQHRFIGQSSADKTMDVQVTRSHMLRQAMDNLYLSNAPRMLVDENSMSENTVDDMLTVRPGALVRWKGGNKPEPVDVPFVAGPAFQAMEVMTGEREARTGITRHNQGLNPDTLNKTMGGMQMLREAGDQVQEYLARNFAEGLVAPMFAKRYRLMRKFGEPFSMKIDGQRVQVDPTVWPEDIDMLINVGLGTGRKDQRILYRMQLLEQQKEGLAAGSPLVTIEHVYKNMRGLIRDAALGNPSDYVVDPDTLKGEDGKLPEQPNPAMAEAQANAEIKAAELEQKGKEAETASALKQRQALYDHDARMEQVRADIELKREEAALEAELRRDRASFEAQLAIDKMEFEKQLALERWAFDRDMKRQVASDDNDIPAMRPGGDLAV